MGYKMKSHKGARKRFKVTASGKVRYRRSFAGHLMSGKTGDRKRKLRRPGYLFPADAKKVIKQMDQ
jgi:large subunit ribosomal protein L35